MGPGSQISEEPLSGQKPCASLNVPCLLSYPTGLYTLAAGFFSD